MKKPSLEDHFTQIDIAAKSVRSLGPDYDSRKLGAIGRMTIHRLLSQIKRPDDRFAHDLLTQLTNAFEVTIITTNWDTHVEWILDQPGPLFNYGVEEVNTDGTPVVREGNISLLKLPGCVNMAYCDCCHEFIRLKYGYEAVV